MKIHQEGKSRLWERSHSGTGGEDKKNKVKWQEGRGWGGYPPTLARMGSGGILLSNSKKKELLQERKKKL